MPPKPKRGRPPGSKNKKTMIKNEIIEELKIKSEESNNSNNIDDNDVLLKNLAAAELSGNQEYFNCNLCFNKNFKLKQNFDYHMLMEHSTVPGSIPCKRCRAVCPDKEALDNHIKKAHIRETFECEHCGKKFARQAHVFRHMAQKGCGKSAAKFACEICNTNFSRKDNLIVHLRVKHIRNKVYQCKKCYFQSKNLTKLIRHWHAKHADTPNQFICDICAKSTTSRAAMAKHLEIHGDKKYSCDVCHYSTYTVEVMRRHVLTHVDEKPYKCAMCPTSFIQRSQLQRHLEKHVNFQCCYCKKILRNHEEYTVHLRYHINVEDKTCPFEGCDFFNVEFENSEGLQDHLKGHIGQDKSFPCDVCGKRFQSEVNMRRHLNTHTLDKPRRCMYCVSARAYVRGVQLVRHVRSFHAQVFRAHLARVRQVLKVKTVSDRVSRAEMECVLNVLDAESERILEGYGGAGVLYGGMQEVDSTPVPEQQTNEEQQEDDSPVMSEENLSDHISQLLEKLIDAETLECFGWPDESVDVVLEKLIEQCGAKPADRDKWTRVQRLRENAKHLFLYVVDDKNVANMLDTHTIDQIVKHILEKFTEDDDQST